MQLWLVTTTMQYYLYLRCTNHAREKQDEGGVSANKAPIPSFPGFKMFVCARTPRKFLPVAERRKDELNFCFSHFRRQCNCYIATVDPSPAHAPAINEAGLGLPSLEQTFFLFLPFVPCISSFDGRRVQVSFCICARSYAA